MTPFFKLSRLKPLLVLALISMPLLAQACFNLNQPPKPIFTKQGSTIFATYTVTGNVVNLAVNDSCILNDLVADDLRVRTAFGYTYDSANFSFSNGKSLSSNCTPSIDVNKRLVFTQKTVGTCSVSFNMVYPLTGSYTGSQPSTDIILTPIIFFRTPSTFGSNTVFTNPITIPPEPARTCTLTHPGIVTMKKTNPNVFLSANVLVFAGNFSVTLNCEATTSARSGIPRLILAYPSALQVGLCVATNQADPAVASPVSVQIKRTNNSIVCGDSAIGLGSVQDFTTFTNAAAYSSTLDFFTIYIAKTTNPAPGIFTTSVTLQVSYP